MLSPVTGLVCHRRRRSCLRKLDASVGASGPHDFAVRVSAVRLQRRPRPPHPAPYVRDDRETPLCVGRDGKRYRFDLGQQRRGIFLKMGLDRANQIDPLQQIPPCAQAISGPGRELINAPIGLTARVRFVPDSRRIAPSQRNDAMCQERTWWI